MNRIEEEDEDENEDDCSWSVWRNPFRVVGQSIRQTQGSSFLATLG